MIVQAVCRQGIASIFPALRLHRYPNLLLALLLFGLAGPAFAATLTVGGAGCSHPDLNAALVAAAASPGFDEIRLLAGSSYQGQFLVNSDALSIAGGFATCAATTPSGSSTLLGTNASRALFLNSFGTVLLSRLNITGGTVTGDGGGALFQGSGNIQLTDVLLFGSFLAWAVADFISARRRDRLAGRTYPVCCCTRDASVTAIGLLAWVVFA